MRSVILVVIIGGLVAFSLAAGGPQPTGQLTSAVQTREFTERFLRTLETARTHDAFQLLRPVITDPQTDVEQMRNTTDQQLLQARNTYGKSIGHELLDTKTLGESFIRYDYLFRLERSALHFRVIYYKGRNNYVPVQLFFSEDLEQLYYDLGK